MGPIRAVLIDFDGVLRGWPANDHLLEDSFGLTRGAIRDAAFEPELLLQATTGRLSDEQWRSKIARQLLDLHEGADVRAAVAQWSGTPGEIDHELLAALRLLKGRLLLGLLTNATSRLPQDLQALDLQDFFDGVFNSSEIGHAKPDPRIFRAAMECFRTHPHQVLYFDDSAANVRAAAQLGIQAVLYAGTASLRDALSRHGVLLSEDMAREDAART